MAEQEFYMDGYLKKNLDTIKKVIKKDWDMVYVIDGMEGSGKSVLALQLAAYCDHNFNANKIAYTPEEFKAKIIKAGKYEAVVFDEALTGFLSRNAMSAVNKTLVQMMAEIRQKNLFVFIVLPSFFDLDRNIALWRSRGMFHVYTDENMNRGRFAYWNYGKKKLLWVQGKKFYSYSRPVPTFRARFTNFYPINQEEYRKRKIEAFRGRDMEESSNKFGVRDKLLFYICEVVGVRQRDIRIWLEKNKETLSKQRISCILKEISKECGVKSPVPS